MRKIGMAVGLFLASGAMAGLPDARLHSAELRLLELDRTELREVVPGAVYMRHWFGSDQSTALFRFPPAAASAAPAKLAFHSHGTELAVQLAGESQIVDERGRRYPLREGDVLLVKANVRHTGTFGAVENRILSVVTPARPEYPAEDGTAHFPGHGQPATSAAPARTDYAGPPVRTLFNLASVEATLAQTAGGEVAHRHWHGDDVSVAVTRLRRAPAGHLSAPHAVHGEEFVLVLRGQMAFALAGGAQLSATRGQAVVLPPYRAHGSQCLTAECLLLSWHGPRRDEWGSEGSLPPLRFITTGGGAVASPVPAECPCHAAMEADHRRADADGASGKH